jgi:hypothetical protein
MGFDEWLLHVDVAAGLERLLSKHLVRLRGCAYVHNIDGLRAQKIFQGGKADRRRLYSPDFCQRRCVWIDDGGNGSAVKAANSACVLPRHLPGAKNSNAQLLDWRIEIRLSMLHGIESG